MRIREMLAAVLLAGTMAHAQTATDEAAILRGYYSGNGLLNRGLYDLAAAEYELFLDEHPDHDKSPMARYGLAVSLFRLARYESVVEQLEVLGTPAGFQYAAEALLINGQSRLALGDADAAARAFGQVLREHSGHPLADESAALQAEALYESERFDEVQRPCRVIEARWPGSPHRERAELFGGLADIARGRDAAAAERFEAMLDRYPDGLHADRVSLLLAQSLHRSGSVRGALGRYRDVLRRERDEFIPEAMYGLALLLHRTGDHDEAGALLDQLLTRYPDDEVVPSARLMRGRVWFDAGDYVQAMQVFEPLARTDDDQRDDATYWLAKCTLRRGDAAEAARILEQAIATYPDSELQPQMNYDRAVSLLRAGDPAATVTVLESFQSRWRDHDLAADALELEATAQHQQRNYGESLAQCRIFLGRYPDHDLAPDVIFLAAENTYLLGDYDRAVPAYQSFLERYLDHEKVNFARFRLGMGLHRQQRFDAARPWLDHVVKGTDTEPEYRTALLAIGDGDFQRGDWVAAEQYLRDYLSFGRDQPGADDALLKLGLAQQRQGERRAALRSFSRLIEERPDSPHRLHAVFESGQVLVELDRFDEARSAFELVLREGSETPFAGHAMNHLGALALRDADFENAARWFGLAAATLGTGDAAAEALFQQGRSFMAARSYDRAETVLSELSGSYPSHPRIARASALQAIALSRKKVGDPARHERALAAIERVETNHLAELEPALRASLWYEKAWCLRELDRLDEAAKTYRRVLSEQSPNGTGVREHAMLELAELDADGERYEQAAELLRQLQRTHGDTGRDPALNRQVQYRLGLCEFQLGRREQAASLLESWLDDDPDPALVPSARLLCAESLIHGGKYARAIEHLDRLIVDNPDDEACAPALLRLGTCHAELQHWTESEQAFATYLRRFADTDLWFQAQFGIGWARENEGSFDDAIRAYSDVTMRHHGPTAARAQFQVGECLFAQRRFDEAVRELIKVDILYAYPQWSAAALYEAGRCFQETGNPVDARKQYEQVRRDYGDTRWSAMARQRLGELATSGLPGH